MITCQKQLNIVWRDEFEGQSLDRDKWDVDNEFAKPNCKGNWMQQLHCNLDQPKNLQSTHECLAITAAHETNPYLLSNNKSFSSAMITSKKSWTYGRFEIRAALPNGKMLRTAFIMIPAAEQTEWPLNGQIDVMTNIQDSSLDAGAHYGLSQNGDAPYTGAEYNAVSANLQDFHTYAVEWNETHIQWFFDDNKYSEDFDINKTLTTDYTKNGQPFDKAFKFTLSLGVGGDADYLFPGMTLTESDYMSWKCSAIIIDYVRVYEWVDNHTVHSGHISSVGDRTSSADICESVMSYIRSPDHTDGDCHTTPGPIEPMFKLTLTSIVSIICGLIIAILIVIVIFLAVRQKRLNLVNQEISLDSYDDCRAGDSRLKRDETYDEDEFEGPVLDREHWDVDNTMSTAKCMDFNSNRANQLHCNLDHPKNLQLRDGCLAITAAQESNNTIYSSALITTTKSWTYGRFVIRAALPNGKMLRPVIVMFPVAGHEGRWPIGGQIDILSNNQNSLLNGGAHYGSPAVYSNQGHRKVSENLQDFHTYGVEWNETHIQWFFDDQDQLQNLDINRTLSDAYERKGQPFDRPFRLRLELGVGGDADYLFPGQTLTDRDYKSWKCSAFIIDYIRVYQWVDSPNSSSITGDNRTSSADICEDVMSHIRSYNKTDDNKSISANPTGVGVGQQRYDR
ncbi:unnamed protein product [Oppiella nova]|uniref:GH16 domain-containing protein n=1 Tax=Oppiella nova TaxID=334625 RepID=A0A7R9QK04_9ACAR|nr:unnamed protein product [Oppiella nova]CAG2167235.1 unnamed protein product [Oppiella nova]